MPAPHVTYYSAVADLMVPFLRGRKVAVEQWFPEEAHPIYRRHEGTGAERHWIAIRAAAAVIRWARQYAVSFHAHLKPDGPGCWFLLDIDARALPLAMARLGALHALDLLDAAGLSALVKFSGANGFHLMWNFPSLSGLGGTSIWDFEQQIVVALAAVVEARLAVDPRARPIRAAVGPDAPLVATNSQDAAEKRALLFDRNILKENANVRVPYSLHAGTGLVSLPLDRAELVTFAEPMAAPEAVMAHPRPVTMPDNAVAAVRTAVTGWHVAHQ